MRRPIGWIDRENPEQVLEIKVSIHAEKIQWRCQDRTNKEWLEDFVPQEKDWNTLEKKLLQLMQRGHQLQKEIDLVRKNSC